MLCLRAPASLARNGLALILLSTLPSRAKNGLALTELSRALIGEHLLDPVEAVVTVAVAVARGGGNSVLVRLLAFA